MHIPLACEPEELDRVSDDEDSDEENFTAETPTNGSPVETRDVEEVLRAWDDLVSAKQPGKVAVHGWSLEYVLRKAGDRTTGDCYAKMAGCPRLRSRVALVAAFKLDQVELQAMPGIGLPAESIPATLEHDEVEDEKETDEQPSALAARMDGKEMPEVVEEGQPPDASADEKRTEGACEEHDATTAQTDGSEMDASGERHHPQEGGPSEGPRRKTPQWAQRMGGFGDGDTSLSPPHNSKRRAS